MNPALRPILIVHDGKPLCRMAQEALERGGFEVVAVADPTRLVETARSRPPAALVVAEGASRADWRAWRSDPELDRVPVMRLSKRRPTLPLRTRGVFPDADACLRKADLQRPGAAPDALRALIERGRRGPSTSRERAGETLWFAGIVLSFGGGTLIGLLGVIGVILASVLDAPTMAPWALGLLVGGASLSLIGVVLRELGGRLSRGERLGLRWNGWLAVALLVLGATLLLGRCGS